MEDTLFNWKWLQGRCGSPFPSKITTRQKKGWNVRRQTRVRVGVKHSLLEFYGVDWLDATQPAKRNTKNNRSGAEIESICSELELLYDQILAWEDWGKQYCGQFTQVKRVHPRFWACREKFYTSQLKPKCGTFLGTFSEPEKIFADKHKICAT